MQRLDLLVGAVSVLFGVFLAGGAAMNAPWLMQLAKPRLLAGAIGNPLARSVLGALGVGLVALGIAIASGWQVNWR
jgi:hypothetical protein